MSASGSASGSGRGSDDKGSVKSSKKSSSAMDHFGSEVDIKIRMATGNPKVEKYFGSVVDLGGDRGERSVGSFCKK
jgi:hypothetical protein